MNDDYLQLDDDSVNSFLNRFNKVTTDLGDSSKQGQKHFEGPMKAGLGGTANIVTNEMSGLSEAMFDFGNVFKKGTDGIFEADSIAASEFEKIVIPGDFRTAEQNETSKHVSIFLDKQDGKSVNDGQASEAAGDIDDSSINKEGLTDIRGTDSTVENYNDESSIRGQSILGDIVTDATVEQAYDDSYSGQREALTDINGDETQEQEFSDQYSGTGENLHNINGDETQEQEFSDQYTESGQALQGMNSDQTVVQSYVDSTGGMGQVYLSDVGSSSSSSSTPDNTQLNEELTRFSTATALTEEEKARRESEQQEEDEVVDIDYDRFF